MTNTVALWLGGTILAFFAADALVLGWNLPVVLGQQFLDLLAWVAFWR